MKLDPVKILLVEDTPTDAILLSALLQQVTGVPFEIINATDLSTAIRLLSEGEYDVILLDLGLPDSFGITTFERVKSLAQDKPVIVISGNEDDLTRADVLNGGAGSYLTKNSLDGNEIAIAILSAIRRNRAELLEQRVQERTKELVLAKDAAQVFQHLIFSVRDYAIFALDPDGHIVTWNMGAERIKGYRANEIVGQHFSIFYTQEARDRKHPELELEIAKRVGHYEEEGWRVKKDGSMFWANVILTPLYNEQHEFVGFAKVTRDLTERKNLEKEREDANKRLQLQLEETIRFKTDAEAARDEALQASALKSQFIANISHEIRTPMNAILGLTELMVGETAGQTKETLEVVLSSAKHLMGLVNDLLDWSKFEAGKIEIANESFIIETVINDVVAAFDDFATKKNLLLIAKVDPLVRGEFQGDADRIKQVLQKLVHNAVKFTDAGTVSVTAQMQNQDDTKKYVRFSVVDTGPGLSEENQKKLFQLFVQIDGSSTRRHGGIGIGLALSNRLVGLLGGFMGVNSVEGTGSTFWFTLPLEMTRQAIINRE